MMNKYYTYFPNNLYRDIKNNKYQIIIVNTNNDIIFDLVNINNIRNLIYFNEQKQVYKKLRRVISDLNKGKIYNVFIKEEYSKLLDYYNNGFKYKSKFYSKNILKIIDYSIKFYKFCSIYNKSNHYLLCYRIEINYLNIVIKKINKYFYSNCSCFIKNYSNKEFSIPCNYIYNPRNYKWIYFIY